MKQNIIITLCTLTATSFFTDVNDMLKIGTILFIVSVTNYYQGYDDCKKIVDKYLDKK